MILIINKDFLKVQTVKLFNIRIKDQNGFATKVFQK